MVRNSFVWWILPLLLAATSNALASNDMNLISVKVKSGIFAPEVDIKHYKYSTKKGYEGTGTSSSEELSFNGKMLGPELTIWHRGLYLRGFYMKVEGDLPDQGRIMRRYTGFDIGKVGRSPRSSVVVAEYFGFRHARLRFSEGAEEDFSNQNISDLTLGAYVGSDLTRSGFKLGLDGAFSARLALWAITFPVTAIFKWHPTCLEMEDNNTFFDGQLNIGYVYRPIGLEIKVGWCFLYFAKPITKYEDGDVTRLEDFQAGVIFDLAMHF